MPFLQVPQGFVRGFLASFGYYRFATPAGSRLRIQVAVVITVGYFVAIVCPAVMAGGPELAGRYGQVRHSVNPFEIAEISAEDQLSRAGRAKASGGTLVVNYAAFERLSRRLEAAEEEILSLRQAQENVTPVGSVVPPEPAPAVLPAPETVCDECFKDKAPEDDPLKLPFLTPLSLGEGRCYCGEGGDITFKPGYRIQSRYLYNDFTNNNDFFIRRFRLKGGGDLFGFAKYYGELKFDGTGAFETQAAGIVENAWVDFRMIEDFSYLRVGLYDIPISRNALTSDSKLLFMDRTLIKSELTDKGLADNTIGLLLHGRPLGGRFEYSVGIFDNIVFENIEDEEGAEDSDELMPAGRLAWHLLDPETSADGYADYRESYIGEGQRLSVGANGGYLGEAFDDEREFELYAWGVDLFFNSGPFVFQGEYDVFVEAEGGEVSDLTGDGWYVQAGYLLCCVCETAVEIAGRHQELNPEDFANERLRWTSVGMNIYMRDHNLKIQTDYTFKREVGTEIDNDVFQIQLQMDY